MEYGMRKAKLAGIPRTALEQGICPSTWDVRTHMGAVHPWVLVDTITTTTTIPSHMEDDGTVVEYVSSIVHVYMYHCPLCGQGKVEQQHLDYSLSDDALLHAMGVQFRQIEE